MEDDERGTSLAAAKPQMEEAPLNHLARLAREAGAETLARDADVLADRIAGSRFYVAFIGQFKRGKSTLINALLGEAVLPSGVVPVTTIVAVVRYGPERRARVLVGTAWTEFEPSRLGEYASEDMNPANKKGVVALELFHPSSLLSGGMCLVDTPGLGSVFTAASETTKTFVPHIDVAIAVLGGDPPLSADEASVIERVAKDAGEIIFVLNKADRLPDNDREEAKAFTSRILAERLGRRIGPILEVSAAERLTGTGPRRDWDGLLDRLRSLARDSGAELVATAEERAVARIAERLLRELEEQLGALTRPIAESERRIAELRQCALTAERSLGDLAHLFSAEQERLTSAFSERRERFLADAVPRARADLLDRLHRVKDSLDSKLRKAGFDISQEVFRDWVERWRVVEQPAAEEMYRQAAQRFVDLANGFLQRLAESGDPSLAALPRELEPEVGFRARSGLFYTQMMTLTTRSPLAWLVDTLRSSPNLRRSVERGAGEYLERLLAANTARVRSDFDERVLESRRRLEAEVRKHLREIYAAAERALERMRARLASGDAAIQADRGRIEALRQELESLRAIHEPSRKDRLST